jgi:hypothetical protein
VVFLVRIASLSAGQTRAPTVGTAGKTGHAAAVRELWGQSANPAPEETTGGIAICGAALPKHAMVEAGARSLGRVSVRLDGQARLARFAQRHHRRVSLQNHRRCWACTGECARRDACGMKLATVEDDAAGMAYANAR